MTESSAGWPAVSSPFHAGEQALQQRVGMRERMEQVGHMVIRPFMPDQHRALFAKLPFIVVAGVDGRHRPWASLVAGRPGFLSSPDPQTLAVHASPLREDPLSTTLAIGSAVGMLGIQFETRRRNRMNGTVTAIGEDGFAVRVAQSFGNCAKYIQARTPIWAEPSGTPPTAEAEGPILSRAAADLVGRSDTFFIASAAPVAVAAHGVDVSHRGGKPGFVHVARQGGHSVLTSPDFAGNFHFNTFGNLALDPRAGLVFVDFASGGLLSLTGEADVLWDGPELARFAGAQRLLRFRVDAGWWIGNALPYRWSDPQPAPQLASTGSWPA